VAAHDVTRIRGQQSEPAPVWTALESSVLISLVGMLDAVSGDELQRQVESLGAIGITNIFLDLSGVCAMDAGGVTRLGTALRGAEDRGGSLALLDSSTAVRETLSSYDFTSFRPVGGMLH
jgi:anti-anti-sigma factor